MDMNKLTIPPELFYSKGTSELWRPRSSVKLIPIEITQKIAKIRAKNATKNKPKVALKHKRFKSSSNSSRAPELGRIGKIRKSLFKKKLIKKKPVDNALKEKSINIIDNNNILKLTTKEEERAFNKAYNEKIFLACRRLTAEISSSRKRSKSSVFRFFKSKNAETEDESDSPDENDDLVPEIRDFSDTRVNSSERQPVQESSLKPPSATRSENTSNTFIDLIPFEEEAEDEPFDNTAVTIESLLQNLEEGDNDKDTSETTPPTGSSLEGLISTLEGPAIKTKDTTDKPGTTQDKPEEARKTESKQKTKMMGLGKNQMQIDAGQKKFGLVECKECGFSYNTNVPEDEKIHSQHHISMASIPRFRGWVNEKAMEIKDWREKNGRIIHLPPNHKNLKSSYVTEIIGRMELEFGVQDDNQSFHVYLAVYDMKIVGLATVKESVVAKRDDQEKQVRLGVQRLYVRPEFRRKGIAKAILKTITILHHKGDLLKLQDDVAFSSPTEDGKKLIEHVLGSDKVFTFSS